MTDLILQRGGKKILRRPFCEPTLTIGRSSGNTIVLLDAEVSRHHCRIYTNKEKIFLTDTSMNGTLVNGELLKEASLNVGDLITIGPWTIAIEESSKEKPLRTIVCTPKPTQVIKYDAKRKTLATETIKFTITSPGHSQKRLCLTGQDITFGCHPSCTVKIEDPYVSRTHCRITNNNGALSLIDLTSTNGTFMDNVRIESVNLKHSGHFNIGNSTVSWKTSRGEEKIKTSSNTTFGAMIGRSKAIRETFAIIDKVAAADVPVHISGESGTGKELVARELHARSPRHNNPFVAINCGAMPEALVESQLFGHERGSFTGAVERMPGLFEQARGGTIFLDEIGEMPLELQARLLRVLENRTVRRVGGQEEIVIDTRVITATNRNIKNLVQVGRFREDLFFRIHIVPITLPPLRERPEDIYLLAEHFVRSLAKSGQAQSTTDAAMKKLINHSWSGNVRELRNTIERALLFCHSTSLDAADIQLDDLSAPGSDGSNLRKHEREIIVSAIESCKGNMSRAARKLGVARSTLQKKIGRYAISIVRRKTDKK